MRKAALSGRFPLIFFLCATVVWVSAALTVFLGCGKKAPPLPPHLDPVPPVSDLSHNLEGSRVMLTWTIPDKVKQGAFGEGMSILFRAKTRLTDELCPDCPLAFQRIAEVPILRTDGEAKPSYEEEVRQGFRYTYKVMLHMESGRGSESSNLVEFDYQGVSK